MATFRIHLYGHFLMGENAEKKKDFLPCKLEIKKIGTSNFLQRKRESLLKGTFV